MKPLIFLLLTTPLFCSAQYDCENFPAASVSYIAPKTIAVGIEIFREKGFNAGAGAGFTPPKSYSVKQGANTFDSTGNAFDLYAFVGYRVLRIDYSVSVFATIGYTMGDKEAAHPVASIKILIPTGQRAVSLEPFYILDRGFSAKASIYFRL